MTKSGNDPAELTGAAVLGADGAKLGKVDQVYLDNQTGAAEWAAVKTGMFGGHVSLVPLAQSNFDGKQLQVPYGKDQMKDAPHHDPGQELSEQDEAELYQHYGFSRAEPAPQSGGQRQDRSGEAKVTGHDTSGPTTDDAMTRSEEQLHVGTESREVGRARLRKFVVTENVTQTVPVSHDEVRLEREPITDANRGDAMAGGDITEEEHEVALHAERAVVGKETVPVERVRLGTETVRGEQTVSESVRKEQIDDPQTTNESPDKK